MYACRATVPSMSEFLVTVLAMADMRDTASTGCAPTLVSPDNMHASAPSNIAFATSEISARVAWSSSSQEDAGGEQSSHHDSNLDHAYCHGIVADSVTTAEKHQPRTRGLVIMDSSI